jgi:hypothetical protein
MPADDTQPDDKPTAPVEQPPSVVQPLRQPRLGPADTPLGGTWAPPSPPEQSNPAKWRA